MDRAVDNHRFFLRYLTTITEAKQLKSILRSASNEEIKAVVELAGNLANGGIACRISTLTNLEKYKGKLRALWDDHKSIDQKREDLIKNFRLIFQLIEVAEPFIKDISHV